MTKRFDRRTHPAGTLDVAKTRDAVQAYFGVYRKFAFLVASGTVPREELTPIAGYEDAADPDAIHAPGFSLSAGGIREIDGKLRYMGWFIRDVRHTVHLLSDFRRDLIRVQYMGREQLKNEDAYRALVEMQWRVSERYYRVEKSEALDMLAQAWSLEIYQQLP